METKSTTQHVLKVMNVLFWIVFIGLCIKIVSNLFTNYLVFTNTEVQQVLNISLDPFEKHNVSVPQFIPFSVFSIILTILKAYMAFLVIKVSRNFNLERPFNFTISRLITKISYIALAVGIFQLSFQLYGIGLLEGNFQFKMVKHYFRIKGEFLFLAGIIFIIAQVFKRGLEIQSENELTI